MLSISNNVAEGSGSALRKYFVKFLNYPNRSVFKTVSMVLIARRRNYFSEQRKEELIKALEEIHRLISGYASLINKNLSKHNATSIKNNLLTILC